MIALALTTLLGVEAFQAPAASRPALVGRQGVSMSAITPGDVGTTAPLGVYDPLGLMTKMPEK
eukprot:CAMPEP_0119351240 /NCGR_PEP_ID=MMETSP1334-20130426/540_1 /TAXON_ID=127549 /ORGANISM="Calcidiscus leptoporus, Strain RCC1130" /LENGTH=62 /DNA_ID=CAMNT_0007363995 /DNA_START=47 /DNA_END=232 /DNA_ORIENTATION=-